MNKKISFFIFGLLIAISLVPFQSSKADDLSDKLKGRILLQVESKGEAWYVNPKDSKRYYMANGTEAYNIMRNLGVGVTNSNLEKIKTNKSFAKKNSGKIFLQVESKGEAYYIDVNGGAHYLKDGNAAYSVMRELGLGIKNVDLNKIRVSASSKIVSTSNTTTNITDNPTDVYVGKSINEIIKLTTLDVKVNSAGSSNDINGVLGTKIADANTKFVQFNLEVTNTTNSSFTFSSDVFELVDGKGRVYSPLDSSTLYLYNYLNTRTLAPGIKETGNIVYNLPLDSFDYKLRVRKRDANEIYLINIPTTSVYDKNGGLEKVGTNTPLVATSVEQIINKAIGDTVEFTTMNVRVNSVREDSVISARYGGAQVAKSGAKFVIANLTITSTIKADTYFDYTGFPLIDNKDRQFSSYGDSIGHINDYIVGRQLSPSVPETGSLVYEIPSDATSYSFVVGKAGTDITYKILLK